MRHGKIFVSALVCGILYGLVASAACAGVPPAPVISATPGNGSVTISWNDVFGASAYNLYWSTSPNVNIKNNFTMKVPGITGSSFTQTQLSNGITYYFVLQSVSNKGASYGSNTVSATPGQPAEIKGFTGVFAPDNWQIGENPRADLVDVSSAPQSVTLRNYAAWAVSGATFMFPKAPSNGSVKFSYALSGATSQCPGAYVAGGSSTLLAGGSQPVQFAVTAGESFGFALNGQNVPQNFGCRSGGSLVQLTITDFSFTPL